MSLHGAGEPNLFISLLINMHRFTTRAFWFRLTYLCVSFRLSDRHSGRGGNLIANIKGKNGNTDILVLFIIDYLIIWRATKGQISLSVIQSCKGNQTKNEIIPRPRVYGLGVCVRARACVFVWNKCAYLNTLRVLFITALLYVFNTASGWFNKRPLFFFTKLPAAFNSSNH